MVTQVEKPYFTTKKGRNLWWNRSPLFNYDEANSRLRSKANATGVQSVPEGRAHKSLLGQVTESFSLCSFSEHDARRCWLLLDLVLRAFTAQNTMVTKHQDHPSAEMRAPGCGMLMLTSPEKHLSTHLDASLAECDVV